MYAAVLDACVLVPNALCDTLLRMAEAGFFRPLWSDRILDEVRYAVMRIHTDIPEERIQRRLDAMNSAFDDASVSGWQAVTAGLDLPDPDDRHVLAAAIAGGGQAIVTFNLKHFPDHALMPSGVEARHPDEFLLDQLDLRPSVALEVMQQQAADMAHPPSDLAGLLSRLERCGVSGFVEAVRRLAPENA
ncbi:MAG TPA: PIN domain-containing protein [Mycobacteriales bacterium]|nr:PIN domain-containing protein [Mycobacteriales bacterium]